MDFQAMACLVSRLVSGPPPTFAHHVAPLLAANNSNLAGFTQAGISTPTAAPPPPPKPPAPPAPAPFPAPPPPPKSIGVPHPGSSCMTNVTTSF